jgi:hypothetical protein
VRRTALLEDAHARRDTDLAVLQKVLASERMWRLAGNAKPTIEPNSPRDLQQLLARENFSSPPEMPALATIHEEMIQFMVSALKG